MSYAKHFQVEKALGQFNLPPEEIHSALLLSLTAWLAKTNSLELNLSASQILEKTQAPAFIRDYFLSKDEALLSHTMESFEKASPKEISSYITETIERLNEERRANERLELLPLSLYDLSAFLLKIRRDDNVTDMGSGFSYFLLNARKKSGAVHTKGIEIDRTNCLYANILSVLQKEEVLLMNEDVFSVENLGIVDKIFCYLGTNAVLSDSKLIKYAADHGVLSDNVELCAEAVFILKALDFLSKEGSALFVVMPNFLSSKQFLKIREYLVKNGFLRTVVLLPENLLPRSSVSPVILLLDSDGKKNKGLVRIVNASSVCEKNRRGGNQLTEDNVSDILSLCERDCEESLVLTAEQIAQKNYDLTPVVHSSEAKIPMKGCSNYLPLGKLVTRSITRGVQYKADFLESLCTDEDTGMYYIVAKDILENQISKDLQHISDIAKKDQGLTLKNDDLLLVMVLADSVKVAVVEGLKDQQILPASNLYVIRVDKSQIEPVFLKMLFESDQGNKIFREFSVGNAIHSVSAKFLNELLVPIPPMSVQQELVQKYMDLERERDALKKQLEALSLKKKGLLD